MKRLHLLIIKSFIGPFLGTFFIAMFFLVMQFLWKYIDDLMGKGLDLSIILELLLYASTDLIPMAVPLAILLSSIMVFGKFGELNELTAMKSAGMSLFRIFLPLTILVLLLSVGAFFFSNYTWPSSHFKMRVLISDITQKKAALSFQEGIYYNDIEDHSIYVGKKIDDTHFEDVYISDLKKGSGHRWRTIYAKSAEIKQSTTNSNLELQMFNGFSDEDLEPGGFKGIKNPFRHTDFDQLKLNMELTGFDIDRNDSKDFQESMLYKNYAQLTKDRDSLIQERGTHVDKLGKILLQKLFLYRDTTTVDYDTVQAVNPDIFIKPPPIQNKILKIAKNNIERSKKDILSRKEVDINYFDDILTHVNMARNRIFTLSIVIIVLFFIGAPLGAISKKGGIGLPVVFAVIFFIIYYILSVFGEKMAKEQVFSPFWGMWLSSICLTPVAIFLLFKSNSDSKIFDRGFYKKLFKKKKA